MHGVTINLKTLWVDSRSLSMTSVQLADMLNIVSSCGHSEINQTSMLQELHRMLLYRMINLKTMEVWIYVCLSSPRC
ncbi:AT-hook motif nuclear-localized protein [Psidium guajava]|nr:AT-hook motif nuclear-localized protein [Psidium guajava]